MKTLDVSDIVSLANFIQNQKGKYAKQTLAAVEQNGKLDPVTRKAILDNFNNYARAICRAIGYSVEE